MRRPLIRLFVLALGASLAGCPGGEPEPAPELVVHPELDPHFAATGCWALQSDAGALTRQGDGFAFVDGPGTPLYAQPADLGVILLHDPDGAYLVADGELLAARETLISDAFTYDESTVSGAEWAIETSQNAPSSHQLRVKGDGRLLGGAGLVSADGDAAALTFAPAEGCVAPPELSLDAEGAVTRTTWDDGELFGFVDMHSHIFTNHGFGGGLFHGRPFHPLGVEHALPDCEAAHGPMGRSDLFGYFFNEVGDTGALASLVIDMADGELSEDHHATDGFPTFSDWPNVRKRSTHQAQYYRWIERAYLSGLRLVVQLATSNAVICNLSVGEGWAPSMYDCEDMTATDRQIDAAWALQDYVDAHHGGPGQGWFRVVTSPAEAREVIAAGKLAVVLGIETSDLFDCHLTPRPGGPVCDEAWVTEQLDLYEARGVRVIFPVHKYDNAFAPGDGQGGFIEVGNFLNSGHWTNKVTDCPTGFPGGFDDGPVSFSGLLEPRDEYLSPPPVDMTDFPLDPVGTTLPYTAALLSDPVPGDHCQNGTLTDVGEHLVQEMLRRGMIVDLAHLPRFAYLRAYELLEEADYPGLETHGRDNNGRLFDIGGLSQGFIGRCHTSGSDAHMNGYRARLQAMVDAGMHRSLGFAFDLNGFAGGPGPRFGPEGCGGDQQNPTSYPFTSYAGDVTFTEPRVGERAIDFDTEGMIHIGLLPELVQDARVGGAGEGDMEALFRSAEGWVRMWEKAEDRAAALRETE